jgi:hypothetical protein
MPDAPRQITVAELERWEEHGATWRTLELSPDRAVVELCTCYGEPVDRLEGTAPELIAFVRDHRGSDRD